ncbi:MAG: T9SS type A sorting domain-containing protein [bacterium]
MTDRTVHEPLSTLKGSATRRFADPSAALQRETSPVFTSPGADTFVVAEYTFDGPLGPDPQGWTSVDATEQLGVFWHVDDFMVPAGGGNKSMWCGARAGEFPSLSSYECLPGYGNGWDQRLETPNGFSVQGDVSLSFIASWDTEAGYDFVDVEYLDKDDDWVNLATVDGAGSDLPMAFLIPAAELDGFVKFRFRFTADCCWSDEDCLFDTNGAVRLDNIMVSDSTGPIHFEDFEDEAIGATSSDDGVWAATVKPGYGDFAALYLTSDLRLECTETGSYAWGFLSDGRLCGNFHPLDTPVVPYKTDGLYLDNEVWSPVVDWTRDINGNPIDPAATRTVLQFWLYLDMEIDITDLAAVYDIRSFAPGSQSGAWAGSEGQILGGNKYWGLMSVDVTDLIEPGSDRVQILLGARDIYLWCLGIPECGNCHFLSPMFDDVRLVRVFPGGLNWRVRALNMFADNFPADGTVTGTVRMDAPFGDVATVEVRDDVNGLAVEPSTGTPAVYVHVRATSGQTGSTGLGDETTYLTDDGEWTVGVCAPGTYADEYVCDFNDSLFVPGDRVEFYFSARTGVGAVNYFSLVSGVVLTEAEARARPDEAQCLPTGASDILYVDAAESDEIQSVFENAFQWLGISPDRFDIRSPKEANISYPPITSTLWTRAQLGQLADVYRTIIYNTGSDLDVYTISLNDDVILQQFLDSTVTWDPGLYVSGDQAAHWIGGGLRSHLGITAGTWDHARVGEPFSPTVHAAPSGIFDHLADIPPGGLDVFIASNYYCPVAGWLDVMSTFGTGQAAMYYSNDPSHVATITNEVVNFYGNTARGVTDAFSFERIQDDGTGPMPDRVNHLKDILEFLRGDTITVVAVEGAPAVGNTLEQNYPNPFNPRTTIEFSIKESTHVSLRIYNVAGQLVRTLADAVMTPRQGGYVVDWDGRSDTGRLVSSGIYFYRLEAGDFVATRKMILLK